MNPDHPTTTVLPAAPEEPPAHDGRTGPPAPQLCRRCKFQTVDAGIFCPQCGTPYAGRRKTSRGTRRVALLVAAVLPLGGAGTGLGLAIRHDNQIKAEQAAASAAAKKEAAAQEKAEAKEAAQQEADDAERSMRSLIVGALEDSIRKDAKQRVDKGELTGPILSASCTPMGGGSIDDLTALTGSYDCTAVNEKRKDGTSLGYRFSGTTNWDDGSYSWHLGG